jgi:hypothetical protein
VTRLPSETNGAGLLRDTFGRRELTVRNLNDPLGPGDVPGVGTVFDADGREQVVITGQSGGTLALPAVADVRTYGADPSGAADSAGAFLAAYQSGRPVYAPTGSYRLDTNPFQGGTLPLRLYGDGPGATELVQTWTANATPVTGSRAAGVALGADAVAGTTAITVATTTFTAGDLALVRSTALWPQTDKGATKGELVRIDSIGSGVVNLKGALDDSYLTADAAVLEKITPLTGCYIRDLTIRNPSPGTKTSDGFFVQYVDGLVVSNVHFRTLDRAGIKLSACINWVIRDCSFFDLTDDAANSRYGYGIDAFGPTRDGRVAGCFMNGGRHAFTTNGYGIGVTSEGCPRHILVVNCEATNMTESCFDTHVEGEHVTFVNCRAHNTRFPGFQMRARNCTLIGCEVDYCLGPGIFLRSGNDIVPGATTVAALPMGHTVFDCVVRNVKDHPTLTAYKGRGIWVESQAVTIIGARIDTTDQAGIWCYGGNGANHFFQGIDIKNPGRVTDLSGIRYTASPASSTQNTLRDVIVDGTGAGFAVFFDGVSDTGFLSSAIRTRNASNISNKLNVMPVDLINIASATTLGAVSRKIEVFDSKGTSMGFIPVYSSIT